MVVALVIVGVCERIVSHSGLGMPVETDLSGMPAVGVTWRMESRMRP